MPGPPPNPNARRRNARPDWVELPSGGRPGVAPVNPLPPLASDDFNEYESRVWADLWATPQAVMWERLRWTRTVARYARVVVSAEMGMGQTMLTEARQLEDHLGLTPMSLKRLQWSISEDEVAAQRKYDGKATKAARLKAV